MVLLFDREFFISWIMYDGSRMRDGLFWKIVIKTLKSYGCGLRLAHRGFIELLYERISIGSFIIDGPVAPDLLYTYTTAYTYATLRRDSRSHYGIIDSGMAETSAGRRGLDLANHVTRQNNVVCGITRSASRDRARPRFKIALPVQYSSYTSPVSCNNGYISVYSAMCSIFPARKSWDRLYSDHCTSMFNAFSA